MGLFDAFKKKQCSICGGDIGLLGNRKLEDGNCCKECAAKLSYWFDDRRHSTVDQIKQQLAYREENKAALNAFRPTVAYGERYTLRAELVNGVPTRFVVERTENFKEENADIINFKDVTAFNIDIQESDRELKQRNSQGEEVSYNPPRYEYSYDFYAEITVNSPYFDDIRFQINRNTLELETVGRRTQAMLRDFDPTLYPEYREYRKECDELEELFRAGMQGMPLNGYAAAAATTDPLLVMVEQIKNAPNLETAMQLQTELMQRAITRPEAELNKIKNLAVDALTDAQMRISRETVMAAHMTAPAAAAPTPAPTPAPEPAGPKFCPNCGAPTDGGKFCQSCGARL